MQKLASEHAKRQKKKLYNEKKKTRDDETNGAHKKETKEEQKKYERDEQKRVSNPLSLNLGTMKRKPSVASLESARYQKKVEKY